MFPTSHFGRRVLRPFVCAAIVLASLAMSSSALAQAQWQQGGILVSGQYSSVENLLVEDGASGAWVVMADDIAERDGFVRRVSSDGGLPSEEPTFLIAGPDSLSWQAPFAACSDGEGGVFAVLIDYRNVWTTDVDLFLQRISQSGNRALGWPAGGLPLTVANAEQNWPAVAPDGTGGAYIAWWDDRDAITNHTDLYMQHVLADGSLAPGWIADGLPVCAAPGPSLWPVLCGDGLGGVIVCWSDGRLFGNTGREIYAQHLAADGTRMPGWPVDGRAIIAGGPIPRWPAGVVADGQGGALVVWTELPGGTGSYSDDVYATRFDGTGAVVAGWPALGLAVSTLPANQTIQSVKPDGLGGVLIAWDDYSAGYGRVGVQRVRPDGTIPPGWSASGTRPTDYADWHLGPDIAPDGLGGAWVTFTELSSPDRGIIQHLSADGVPAAGWPTIGVLVCDPSFGVRGPRLMPDGGGGVICTWIDGRTSSVYAQRYQGDGPTPAQVSLASLDATTERVRVVWQVSGEALAEGTVERRRAEESWSAIGSAAFDGNGRVEFEDHAVVAGTRYAYRLRWREGGVEQTSGESWVVVPIALELALEGARPNPSLDGLAVAFTLPGGASATLEAVDASGRVVRAREVGALGAGRHIVRLDEGVRLAPGRYWLRLRQGEAQRVRTAVVIR